MHQTCLFMALMPKRQGPTQIPDHMGEVRKRDSDPPEGQGPPDSSLYRGEQGERSPQNNQSISKVAVLLKVNFQKVSIPLDSQIVTTFLLTIL